MAKITDYTNYKTFIQDRIKAMPKAGRGQYLQLAKTLNVHSSMITYIFKGKSQLTIEQALAVAEEYNLSPLERDYFLDMVHYARAGDNKTRKFFEAKIKDQRKRFLNLREHVPPSTTIDEKDKAIFYSHWYFAAIQILTAIDGFDNPKAIAAHLGLSPKQVNEALDFLTRTGLCTFDGSRYSYGIAKTFLSRDSLFLGRHHSNWRLKAMQQHEHLTEEELDYTCPGAVSAEDFIKIREEIIQLIERFNKIIDPSPSEELVCLNIDWFKVKKNS